MRVSMQVFFFLKTKLQSLAISGRAMRLLLLFLKLPLPLWLLSLNHIRARLFRAIGFDIFLQPLPTQSHVKTAAGIRPWTSAVAAQC